MCISFCLTGFFFGKPITMRKVGGNVMIIAGIIVCLNR